MTISVIGFTCKKLLEKILSVDTYVNSSVFDQELSINTWYFITITYNSVNNNYRLYVNANPMNDVNNSDLATTANETGVYNIGLVDLLDGGNADGFDGRFDESGIWGRVLSDSEIIELYNNGSGVEYPFPVSLADINISNENASIIFYNTNFTGNITDYVIIRNNFVMVNISQLNLSACITLNNLPHFYKPVVLHNGHADVNQSKYNLTYYAIINTASFCVDSWSNYSLENGTYPSIQFMTPTEISGSYINRAYILINTSVNIGNFTNQTTYLYNSSLNLISLLFSTNNISLFNTANIYNGVIHSNDVRITTNFSDINIYDGNFGTVGTIGSEIYFYINCSVEINNIYMKVRKGSGGGDFVFYPNVSLSECFNKNIINIKYANNYFNVSCDNYSKHLYVASSTTGINIFDFDVYPVFNLNDGIYYFNATVYDIDNISNSTETRNVTIDTTFPYLINYNDSVVFTDNDAVFNFTAVDVNFKNMTILFYNSTDLLQTNFTTDMNFYGVLYDLPNDSYYYNVTLNDLAGNRNETDAVEIILFYTAPETSTPEHFNNTLLAAGIGVIVILAIVMFIFPQTMLYCGVAIVLTLIAILLSYLL